MIFDKAQKKFLKQKGLWKKVKKYAKQDPDYINSPELCGNIDSAFFWYTTEEGHGFWKTVSDSYDALVRDAK